MALKDTKGKYYKAAVLEAINFVRGKAWIRLWVYEDDAARENDDIMVQKVVEVSIPDSLTSITGSVDDKDSMQKMAYSWLKAYYIDNSVDHPAEKDKAGIITKEAYKEEILDYPYADMIDC